MATRTLDFDAGNVSGDDNLDGHDTDASEESFSDVVDKTMNVKCPDGTTVNATIKPVRLVDPTNVFTMDHAYYVVLDTSKNKHFKVNDFICCKADTLVDPDIELACFQAARTSSALSYLSPTKLLFLASNGVKGLLDKKEPAVMVKYLGTIELKGKDRMIVVSSRLVEALKEKAAEAAAKRSIAKQANAKKRANESPSSTPPPKKKKVTKSPASVVEPPLVVQPTSVEPTVPAIQPDVPVVQPTSVEPTVPAIQPDVPVVQPDVPASQSESEVAVQQDAPSQSEAEPEVTATVTDTSPQSVTVTVSVTDVSIQRALCRFTEAACGLSAYTV